MSPSFSYGLNPDLQLPLETNKPLTYKSQLRPSSMKMRSRRQFWIPEQMSESVSLDMFWIFSCSLLNNTTRGVQVKFIRTLCRTAYRGDVVFPPRPRSSSTDVSPPNIHITLLYRGPQGAQGEEVQRSTQPDNAAFRPAGNICRSSFSVRSVD
ncbi:unnamed protein product [Pleuronectes platessa]|uniref:Uncharacterized protein n=1 Tax=Pleuronectes platessa TaxID=8262 RepID=A0A9N7TKL2_PLEPL|nr:unnamed protein product [Pleuronectes platessa]